MHEYSMGMGFLMAFIVFAVGVVITIIVKFLTPVVWENGKKTYQKKTYKAIMPIAIVLAIAAGSVAAYQMGYHYTKGDYAEHKCYYYSCENASEYELYLGMNTRREYYCQEHYSEGESNYTAMVNFKPESGRKGEIQCKSCGRWFRAGDDEGNFMKVAKSGMCNNCYGNYKDMKQFLDE